MHMGYSQLFQMVDTGCQFIGIDRSLFCQCQELSFMFNARGRINGKVTVMHLVNNDICRRSQCRPFVVRPPFRISGFHINNRRTFTVHTNSFGIDSRCVSQPLVVDFDIECIKFAFQVFFNFGSPCSLLGRIHGNCFVSMSSVSCLKQHQTNFIRRGRP